ncbi:MAG: M73 family metallopeptidase [Oscillospiraceae bacterium]|jgi:predicted ribosomally synthesized peptide with SipW-like signal peptide|nr:M73 family metallopeptidase [Oscillospiraceae bacterium]
MKKKLVLGIIAAVLALSLAIGGTLMVFTAQTHVAQNVVTLGNAWIELREVYYTLDGDLTDDLIEEDGWGLIFEDVQPGDSLIKEPYIKNVGSIPVYVAAKLVVSNNNVDGPTVEEWVGSDANSQEKIDAIAGIVNVPYGPTPAVGQDYWFISSKSETGFDSDGNFVTVLYFASYGENPNKNGENDWYLKPVAADGGETSYLFDTISIPLGLDNSWFDVSIAVDITGYAIQSANVTNGDAGSNYWNWSNTSTDDQFAKLFRDDNGLT